jgi:protease-4
MKFFRILFFPITAPLDFIQKYFKSLLFIVLLILLFGSSDKTSSKEANLTKINLTGAIMSSDKVMQKIDKAYEDDNIKGVLFVVNSPGGAVAPSVEIAYAIKRLKAKKPVVTYTNGVLASGSYYASIWSNTIIANPGSMVGSIGVIMQSADISELLSKIGIKPQVAKIGKYKEVATPTREWSEDERKEIDKVIKDTYDMFISDVSLARGLKKEDSSQFADAHIFTARQAKKVGLIDSVGTIFDAQQKLIALSKVKDPIWSKEDKMDKLYNKVLNDTISNISIYFGNILKSQVDI